jgi:thiol:disulfide interchange protein DsbD
VHWTAKLPSGPALKSGTKITADLSATIEDGWHVYSITQPPGGPLRTVITVPADQALRGDGKITGTEPHSSYDPNFQMETQYYEESVSFKVPLVVDSSAKAGPANSVVNVRFQTCNDRLCLPPTTIHVPLAGTIAKASPQQAIPKLPQEEFAFASVLPGISFLSSLLAATPVPADNVPVGGSLLSFLWFAMGFGALSLLTPCVFPMIPITVSYFTKYASESRATAIRNALVYAIGIVATFTIVGMALAIIVGAGGVNLLAASPWVNLLLTAIFVAFALNLFGAFLIQIPPSLVNKLETATRGAGGAGTIGALLMGFTFTLTSFTCTAPFVGTVMVLASRGQWRWPLVGMLGFSTVFALPFFFLALTPQWLSRLPKSGGWLNSVKVTMGFLELAAAMKFISNVDLVWHWGIFTRQVCLAAWVAIGFAAALYLLGVFRLPHEAPVQSIRASRLLCGMCSLAVTFYLFTGLFDHKLGTLESFLPPAEAANSAAAPSDAKKQEVTWLTNDYQGALVRAKQEHKYVFVNFTGYTCTNCRWMESNMFPRPEVKAELGKFILVELYTDGDGKVYEDQQKFQQEKFGTVALPYYAVLDPNGNAVSTFAGLTHNASEFLAFLEKGSGSTPSANKASTPGAIILPAFSPAQ